MAPWVLAIFNFMNVGMFRLLEQGASDSRLIVASNAGAASLRGQPRLVARTRTRPRLEVVRLTPRP